MTCSRLRGQPDNPLLLLSNVVTRFSTRVSDFAQIDAGAERGQRSNLVAVDFFDQGDVCGVVDEANGLGG